MEANVEESGVGIYLFEEGSDDVPVIGVPLFDDRFGVGIGIDEACPFENGVVVDVVLLDDGFFRGCVVFSDFKGVRFDILEFLINLNDRVEFLVII